jgi:hypothetical protein
MYILIERLNLFSHIPSTILIPQVSFEYIESNLFGDIFCSDFLKARDNAVEGVSGFYWEY